MKVLMATVGTRGDIQPYIGLSQMLIGAGHSVAIASSRAHERLIGGFRIPFSCIDETPDTSAIQKVVRSGGLKAIREGVRMLFDGMLQCHEKLLETVTGVDVVIGHGWLGEVESEVSRKRFIRVGISPNVAEKVKSRARSMSERLRIDIETAALKRLIIKPYNDFLRKVDHRPTDLNTIYEKPLLLPISKVLLEPSKLWNDRTYQSSYWYAEYSDYSLPNDVLRVVSNGRKTVLVNFGSMMSGLKSVDDYIRNFYDIAQEMDCNLIWVGPCAFSDEHPASETFVAVRDIPLGYLLPKVDVAFHHCGLGTTSEIIRSGCLSVPVPFVVDQYDWAKRLVNIGAATAPLRPDELTKKYIRLRLQSVFEKDEYGISAQRAREEVLQEIEGDETVKRIEMICGS